MSVGSSSGRNRKRLTYFCPFIAFGLVKIEDDSIFFLRPSSFHNVRVEMVVPPVGWEKISV